MSATPFRLEFPFGGHEQVLRGRVQLPTGPGPHPAVILVHGYKSFMDWGFQPELERRLVAAGMAAVSFNGSGSGLADDPETITDLARFARGSYSQELEDLSQVRRFAVGLPSLDAERLGVFGYSRGGGMSLLHASEQGTYAAAAVWAALPEVLRFTEEEQATWRERGFTLVTEARTGRKLRIDTTLLEDVARNRARFDIRAACRRARTPTLLVAAERDRAVRPAELERLASCFPPGLAETFVAPGVGHAFGARHPLTEVPESLDAALDRTVAHYRRHFE